jgi:hypothetical protein
MSIKEHLQKFMAQQTGLSVTPLLEQGLVAATGPGGLWALTELGLDMLNGEYATTSFAKEQTAQQELVNAQVRAALDLPTHNPGDWVKVDGDHTKGAEEDWTADFLTKFKASNPASSQQVGGDHYRKLAIQPAEFIEKNHIPFLDGCVIKRMCRHEAKAGVEDLRKAIHEIRLIMQLRYGVSE